MGRIDFGSIKVGDEVEVQVNYDKRATVSKNHTGTHLLNFALRAVLGDGVNRACGIATNLAP